MVEYLGYTHCEFDKDKRASRDAKLTPRYTAFVVTRDKVSWLDLGPAVHSLSIGG